MTNIVPLQRAYPCIECDECESTEFWFTKDGQIACPSCGIFLDGVKWDYDNE